MKSFGEIIWAYLNVDGFNKRQKNTDMYSVSKLETYILGILFSALATGITFVILGLVSGFLSIGFVNMFTVLAALGAGIAFFGAGLVTIKVGYLGVLVILGERVRNVEFREGTFWMFPFFTRVEYVDGRQQYSDSKSNKAITSDNVDLDVDADITWLVNDAYERLSTNVKDVEGAVKIAAESSIVRVLNRHTREEVFNQHKERIPADEQNGYAAMTKLERQIVEEIDSKIQVFGGHALKIYISTLLPNAELIAEERRFAIEKAQQLAEELQNSHVIVQINKIAADTGMSTEAATQLFLTQIDKATFSVDQKNLNLNKETRDAIAEIAKLFAGLKGGGSN